MAPVLNLLLPLLFILSIGFLFHSLYLFLKSKSLRKKAVKRAILPLFYIVGTLTFFSYRKSQIKKELSSEVVGVFIYSPGKNLTSPSNDSSLKILLTQDKRFQYTNPFIADSLKGGTWDIDTDPNRIYFYSAHKKLLGAALLKRRNLRLYLVFKDSTQFVKIESIKKL